MRNTDKKVVINRADYPDFSIDGVKYELLCEYDSRFGNEFVKIHVKEGGSDVVVDYGNGTACVGYYSTEPQKIKELLNYIEATISLKSRFSVYSEDLRKHLKLSFNNGEKHPIIRDGIDSKDSFFSRLFNRIHQERVSKELYSKPFAGDEMICSVDYVEDKFLKEPEASIDASESETIQSVNSAAKNLPEGWMWVDYADGSGHLESPTGKSYFSYDLHTSYTAMGAIEYQKSRDIQNDYDAFWGTFEEFKVYAEEVIGKEFCCLGRFNIPEIMNSLEVNAWYGREPTTVRLISGNNVVTLEGYTYEPSYECFSATSSISLNGEVLYGQDSRNVEAYHNEVYQTGKYENLVGAISYIREKINVPELVYTSEPSQVDSLISRASVVSEQNKTMGDCIKDKSNLDIDK